MSRKQTRRRAAPRRSVVKRVKIHPLKHPWTPEQVALLGTIDDVALAEKLGLCAATVRAERNRRGIPPVRPRLPTVAWTPEMIARLGTASDSHVAAELGLPLGCVAHKRKMLAIPSFKRRQWKPPATHRWTASDEALLGTMSDTELARKLGVSQDTVRYRRSVLGIPPLRAPRVPIEWSPEMIRALGTMSDRALAERHGIGALTVLKKRQELGIKAFRADIKPIARTPELTALVHDHTPRQIERLSGLRYETVLRLRREQGLPPPKREKPRRPNHRWSAEEIALLGTHSDRKIAKRLGLAETQVFKKRHELGIPVSLLSKRRWAPEELALLGTVPDAEVARITGRTVKAVQSKRAHKRIPMYDWMRRLKPGRRWR